MCLTSFDDDSTESPTLPCEDNALVDKDAAAPKPCLSPVEMRTLTVAGGLFYQPSFLFCPTEGMNSRISIQYATTYYKSFWKMKVLEAKIRQTLVLDPGGSTGRLRACPFSGWVVRVALWGGFRLGAG